MSGLQKHLLKSKLPPLYPGSLGGTRLGGINRRRDYTPSSWDKYFDSYKDVAVGDDNFFRVYLKGNSGPLLVFLHGGGYSGLTWSLLSLSISSLVECQIAAFDLRGHGETHCADDDDLSAETLSNDVGKVLNSLFPDENPPPVILVGHSMGGAIAVHTVYRDLAPSVIALIVIDVVEGTALNALQSMQSFLRSRPPSFESLPTAIEWCIRSGQVRNVESAKVSMPGQLKNATTGKCAASEINLEIDKEEELSCQVVAPRHAAPTDSIPEEAEDIEEAPSSSDHEDNKDSQCNDTLCDATATFKQPQTVARLVKYVWRIDLSKTEKFWTGWFEGLSNMFLSIAGPKMLLLAGVDRLDRDLTIGQMQGKFQMRVLPQCGHAVHEDDPDKVAEAIATFLVRNKFTNSLCEIQD